VPRTVLSQTEKPSLRLFSIHTTSQSDVKHTVILSQQQTVPRIVYYWILYIVIGNQCITFFLTKVVCQFNPFSLKIGGFWGNLVVIFGFSTVKTINITVNCNREWNKILCRPP